MPQCRMTTPRSASASHGLALLEDWGVPSRLTSLQGYEGCFQGYVTELARHWLDTLTAAEREAIQMLARNEGILLDPVYTGKAMAGLIDHIHQKRIGKNETVVFLHTGGTPALFAYADVGSSGGLVTAASKP